MKEKKVTDLGKDNIGGLLLKLALPAILAQIINVLYNMVDRMYIGHIPKIGSDALTGVGVTMPVIMAISAFAALVSMGGAPRASIMMGKNDKSAAEKILGNCTLMLVIMAAILTCVFFIWGEDILLVFGASSKTIGYALEYMRIYSLGTIFVQLALGLNAFINAQGYAKMGMFTVAIGAICNIILDPIFIFQFSMGVKGAALATIISQGISSVWVVYFLISKKSTLKIKLKNLKPDRKVIVPCLALGLSPFIMQFTESVISVCFNIKGTSNVDEAIESTNEFTALIEALKKADESLEYVIEFLAEKEQEIDQIVSQKMQDVTSDFNESMTSFTQQVNAAVI